MKKKFLLFLKTQSAQSRKEAFDYLRKLSITVLAQYSNVAFEVSGSDSERQVIMDSGLFIEIYEGPIDIKQMANKSMEAEDIALTWNHAHSPSARSAEKDDKRGLSWGTEGLDEPRPYSELSNDFFLTTLQQKGIRDINSPALKEIPFSKSRAQSSFATIEKRLKDKFKDENKVYHLSRLAIVHPELEETILTLPENVVDELLNESTSVKANIGTEAKGPEEACWRMNGEISVGVVFVESSVAGGPTFSSGDRTTLRNEVQTGLNWLASQHPDGNLSWVYDYQYVTINAANGTDSSLEDYWRNPAMQAVRYNGNSYSADWNGVANYRNNMRTTNDSAHAIVVFVTPYATSWHAYADNGRLTLASRNNWGTWGIGSIDTITAHEVCHLFGAADEYTGSGTPCKSCTTIHGCDKVPNGNCKACAEGGGVPCIMDQNSLSICPYTRGHIGWGVSAWRRYELAPAGKASVDGCISAISRIEGSMELWWNTSGGAIHDAYWYEQNPWKQFELTTMFNSAINSDIASVSRIPGSMEIWWIAVDGSVQGAYWYEGNPWKQYQLAPSGSAAQNGSIRAVSRIPGSIEVWWIGVNGSVQGAYWYEGNPWGRYELAPAGSASLNGSINAVSRIPNSLEVWWIGGNGSIQGAYWYEGNPWGRYEIAPAGSAATGGSISAVSRIQNSLEIWWTGGNGSIQGAYWYDGNPWQRYELAPAGSAPLSGSISVVSRIPSSMELWWIGTNGSIQAAYWYEGNPWKRYVLAAGSNGDSAALNGSISAVSRIPGSMELWWIGVNGSIQAAYWYG